MTNEMKCANSTCIAELLSRASKCKDKEEIESIGRLLLFNLKVENEAELVNGVIDNHNMTSNRWIAAKTCGAKLAMNKRFQWLSSHEQMGNILDLDLLELEEDQIAECAIAWCQRLPTGRVDDYKNAAFVLSRVRWDRIRPWQLMSILSRNEALIKKYRPSILSQVETAMGKITLPRPTSYFEITLSQPRGPRQDWFRHSSFLAIGTGLMCSSPNIVRFVIRLGSGPDGGEGKHPFIGILHPTNKEQAVFYPIREFSTGRVPEDGTITVHVSRSNHRLGIHPSSSLSTETKMDIVIDEDKFEDYYVACYGCEVLPFWSSIGEPVVLPECKFAPTRKAICLYFENNAGEFEHQRLFEFGEINRTTASGKRYWIVHSNSIGGGSRKEEVSRWDFSGISYDETRASHVCGGRLFDGRAIVN